VPGWLPLFAGTLPRTKALYKLLKLACRPSEDKATGLTAYIACVGQPVLSAGGVAVKTEQLSFRPVGNRCTPGIVFSSAAFGACLVGTGQGFEALDTPG